MQQADKVTTAMTLPELCLPRSPGALLSLGSALSPALLCRSANLPSQSWQDSPDLQPGISCTPQLGSSLNQRSPGLGNEFPTTCVPRAGFSLDLWGWEKSLRAGWVLLLLRAELPAGIAGEVNGFMPLPAMSRHNPQLLARGAGCAEL